MAIAIGIIVFIIIYGWLIFGFRSVTSKKNSNNLSLSDSQTLLRISIKINDFLLLNGLYSDYLKLKEEIASIKIELDQNVSANIFLKDKILRIKHDGLSTYLKEQLSSNDYHYYENEKAGLLPF